MPYRQGGRNIEAVQGEVNTSASWVNASRCQAEKLRDSVLNLVNYTSFHAAALHRRGYPHGLAVLRHGAAGNIDAIPAQQFVDGIVGEPLPAVLGGDQDSAAMAQCLGGMGRAVGEIGRAACFERVCLSVSLSVVAVLFTKK